jgi:hypothetical protein
MKFTFLSAIIASCLLFACNNNTKPGKESPAVVAAETKEAAAELEKKTDALQRLTPYTMEEMKSLIPVTLNGDSAVNISSRGSMGTGFVSAEYKPSDSSSVELSIFDCAGTAGAGIYNAQYAGLLDSQNDEYIKIIGFKGGKAIEHDDRRRNNYSLSYIVHDRLLVTLDGKNVGIDELKEIAGKLNLNKK